jgi:3,4-dihydroxy 2-butanone 4-phosphate synthase / GTP cyclohydrolase II
MPSLREADAQLAPVEAAVAAIGRGEMVVLVDSPARENEGDLVMAAELATAESVNFMATHARGLVCCPMTLSRLDELRIPPMVTTARDRHGTAFHVGVDLRDLARSGVSAAGRAATIRALASGASVASDFVRPGRVFPLAYRPGGVLRRAGHTEGAVDLVRLAGLAPAAVICEIAGPDGAMARLPALLEFARRHGLLIATISDLIAYRRSREPLVERIAESSVPLHGDRFRTVRFRELSSGREHVAAVFGDVTGASDVLVRLHRDTLPGDAFHVLGCACESRLRLALDRIVAQGRGVVVYLRGDMGGCMPGGALDRDDLGAAMQILRELGVSAPRLLSHEPAERAAG